MIFITYDRTAVVLIELIAAAVLVNVLLVLIAVTFWVIRRTWKWWRK